MIYRRENSQQDSGTLMVSAINSTICNSYQKPGDMKCWVPVLRIPVFSCMHILIYTLFTQIKVIFMPQLVFEFLLWIPCKFHSSVLICKECVS